MKKMFFLFFLLYFCTLQSQDTLSNQLRDQYIRENNIRKSAQDTLSNQIIDAFKIMVIKNVVDGETRFWVLSELYGKVDTVWSREISFDTRSIEQIKIFEKTKMVIIAFGGVWAFRSVFLEWDGTKWNRIMSDIMARKFPGDPPVSFDAINYNKIIYVKNNIKTLIEYDLERECSKFCVK